MSIGASLFLLVIGAILTFAVDVTTEGFNINTVGIILMIAGVIGLLPALAGLMLELLHGRRWELLAFAGVSLLAGFVYQLQVTGAVRLAVDDPELRASYGSR